MTESRDFTDLLAEAGIDPKSTKLLRHDRRALSALKRGRNWFGSFISIQSSQYSPFRSGPRYAAHFVPSQPLASGQSTAVFVGLTEVQDRWPWDDNNPPRMWLAEDYKNPDEDYEAVDQIWLDAMAAYDGRLLINWGLAPRAWHQWANEKRKPIVDSSFSEVALNNAISKAGTTLLLSEIDKFEALLELEERELKREIERNSEAIDREFRQQLVEQRPEQDKFRKGLIGRHGAKCCVTNCSVPQVLEAAHIIPFRKGTCGRDLPSNGLLLRRDIHRLFDSLLISIDPTTSTVWVSRNLRDGDYKDLHNLEIEVFASPSALSEHHSQAKALEAQSIRIV